MPLYEHVFLARQDISPQQAEALAETFKGVIETGGGSVAKTEYWGLKSLSYRIRKNRKAHFTLLNIDAPAAAVAEMERQMGINEDVIRVLTLRVDEHEAGPSAMIRSRGSRDRDDRRGRRDDRDDRHGGRDDREERHGGRDDREERHSRPRGEREDGAEASGVEE